MQNKSPLKLGSKFILPLAMLYLMAMLAADVVAFKFVHYHSAIISGAQIVFPFTYLFGDVITEVYGYSIARKIIWLSLFAELFFSLIIKLVISLPYPSFANHYVDFETTVGSMPKFVIGGIIGNLASSFLNIYLISKWKIWLKGRIFWIRSVLATAISEFIITCFAVLIGFNSQTDTKTLFKIIGYGYSLEMLYAIIFVWFGWWLAVTLKKIDNIDAYDQGVNYNPFKFK